MRSFCIDAQSLPHSIAAPFIGQGAYSFLFSDALTSAANPAALARLQATSAGVYGERRFGLAELAGYSAAVGIPVHSGGIGLAAHYAGDAGFNQSQLGLGYARQLGRVDLGVQFNYAGIRTAGYGSDGALAVVVATTWHVSKQVHTGLVVYNPAGGKFGKGGIEALPRVIKAGLGYETADNLLFTGELIKEEDRPASLLAGIQYSWEARFFVQGGIHTGNTEPWLGAGWAWKNMRADLVARYHPQLGLTPGLLLLFSSAKKETTP